MTEPKIKKNKNIMYGNYIKRNTFTYNLLLNGAWQCSTAGQPSAPVSTSHSSGPRSHLTQCLPSCPPQPRVTNWPLLLTCGLRRHLLVTHRQPWVKCSLNTSAAGPRPHPWPGHRRCRWPGPGLSSSRLLPTRSRASALQFSSTV